MKNFNTIIGFISLIFLTLITTSSYAYIDVVCNCKAEGLRYSHLIGRPMCDYQTTEYCIVSQTSDTLTYRVPITNLGAAACQFCGCYDYTSDWTYSNTSSGVLTRQSITMQNSSTYRCDYVFNKTEGACSSGYYGLSEPDFMIYECQECPWLYDDKGGMAHGLTEYANKDADITDCYIQESDLRGMYFEDETGDYLLEGGDCYYSE